MGSKEDNCERTKQHSLGGAEGEVVSSGQTQVPELGQEVKGRLREDGKALQAFGDGRR